MPTSYLPAGLNLATPKMFDPAGEQSETTTRAQDIVDDLNQPKEVKSAIDPKVKKINDEFRTRIDACKQYRRKLIPNWTTNIDWRRGKPFSSQADSDQIAVNLDWTLTKSKQAQLFSQVPQAESTTEKTPLSPRPHGLYGLPEEAQRLSNRRRYRICHGRVSPRLHQRSRHRRYHGRV
jgi:hypothetical protein